jgi:DNA-binding response OmpR family regulator
MRILLIEDDAQLGKAIFQGLKQDYAADWFRTAEEGADAVHDTPYDVIVLDINLPSMSGLEWLTRLRKQQHATPILLLTACDTVQDRVTGLDCGADDYLIKPFDFEELLARIRALARRKPKFQPCILSIGELILDSINKTALYQRKQLALSQKEFDILYMLVQQAGQYVSKERMEQKLYGWDDVIGSNTIEVHISALRRKLGKEFIKTTRNLGYRIEKNP